MLPVCASRSRHSPWPTMRLGSHIALLCAAVALPLILFAGYGAYSAAKADRNHLESMAQAEARDIAQLIREDLSAKVAKLKALAASTPLQTGDLDGFYHRAHEFTAFQGANVVLRDLNGQQIINTRVAPGTPLPKGADISVTDRQAIETQSPQITDIFTGALAKSPMYMVEMPITLNGKTTYLLGLSMPAQHLAALLKNRPMTNGRWITLIDGNAAIVARTLSPETAIGRKVLPPTMDAIRAADPDNAIFLTSHEGIRNFAALHRVAGTR